MANHNPPTNGFDKRKAQINRKGRPKSFDDVRALAQAIAHEEAIKDGVPIVINGHIATAAEVVLRQWLTSGNFQKQLAFMQYAFGKVPDQITGPDGGPIEFIEIIRNVASDIDTGDKE